MQDNSTNNDIEMLVKYMDGELTGVEKESTEKLLQTNAELQQRYQHLLAAKQAIKMEGLRARVKALHNEYVQDAAPVKAMPAKVIRPTFFVKDFMRVAAVLVLVIAGYGGYQYATTTTQSLYSDNYIIYHLPVNRGEGNADRIENLYNEGHYEAAVAAVNGLPIKTQKDYFIAAQSYLQLDTENSAVNAIAFFLEVQKMNSENSEKYFVQETDYYLALAYIKAGKVDLARDELSKIKANPRHIFYNNAKQISSTKLEILKLKSN